MATENLHPLDEAAAAYRRRARILGLTDVRPSAQHELDESMAEEERQPE